MLLKLSQNKDEKTIWALAQTIAEPYLNAVKAMNDDCLYTLLNHIHPNSCLKN